jgi:hypothetical protein
MQANAKQLGDGVQLQPFKDQEAAQFLRGT